MKRPPTALPGCRDSGLQGCRAAGRGLRGAWLQRQAEGPEQLPELRATARGSSSERVNEKPPCIRMLIVKIVYYLRKVIWLLETPTKETSLCPFHLPGSVKDDELNSKFTCDEVTVIPQPAEHCCHAHRAESSTAFQLFLWNPGGTVTCYLLLLAFFFFSLPIFCLSATTESFCCPWLVGIQCSCSALHYSPVHLSMLFLANADVGFAYRRFVDTCRKPFGKP